MTDLNVLMQPNLQNLNYAFVCLSFNVWKKFASLTGGFVHKGLHVWQQMQELARLPEAQLQQEVLRRRQL